MCEVKVRYARRIQFVPRLRLVFLKGNPSYSPAKSSSSGIGSTELLSSNMDPRRPIRGFLLLVLAVLLPLPLRRSVGWLTPTPCSISKTPPLFSLFASTGSEDSELALDLIPLADPELSLRNNPITDAVLGWSMPPLQQSRMR